MATRIDLPPDFVKSMLGTNEASLKRSLTTAKTEMVKQAFQHELDQVIKARATLTEIK